MMVLEAVDFGPAVEVCQVETVVVGQVDMGSLRGRMQVAKVVHPLKKTQSRLEKRRVGMGLESVVSKW